MITFDPDSPYEVGDKVTLRDGERVVGEYRVIGVDHSDDGSETQYQLAPYQTALLKHIVHNENPVFP